MRHYERYASEDGACFRPYIDGFTQLTVLEDTPDRLVVEARSRFATAFTTTARGDGGRNACTGFGGRVCTLERDADGNPTVVGMTGERDTPLIRSLIGRAVRG